MEYTAVNVEQAVQQFYMSAACQHEVHQWLTKAQISPQAWTFCWELISEQKPTEVQFFGASSIYLKISKFWPELPADQIESLRSQLLHKIVQFSSGPKIVLTRLCLALSSCVLQTIPDLWPDPVQDIISMLQPHNLTHLSSTQICSILLDILTVLPEEFNTEHMLPYRKGVVRHELDKALMHVLPLLQNLMTSSPNISVSEQTIRCFSSWVQFGVPLDKSELLVHQTFQAVRNEALFDTAIEALINLFSHPGIESYTQTVQEFLVNVVGLSDLLQTSMNEQDNEVSVGLTRLIVTAAETHTRLILAMSLTQGQGHEVAISIVKLVLQCTAAPGSYPVEETYSDLPLGFWYILQDDIAASDPAEHRAYVQIFTPLYMSLVEILLRKVQYPSSEEFASWNDEEKEQHRCYRQDISDTLMYAYNLLRVPLLGFMCRVLEDRVSKSEKEEVRWQDIESILLLFTSVAESIDLEENQCLPLLFSLIPKINFSDIKLISQALSMIGSYAEWINCHPQVLLSVIPLLLQGLQNPEVAMAATMALKEVCRENQDHLRGFVDEILTKSKEVLDANILKPRDSIRLMACLGYVLSVLPVERIIEYLNVLLTSHIQQLNELSNSELSAVNKAGILMKINMLCWLFGTLDVSHENNDEEATSSPAPVPKQPQPVLLVLQQLQPVLQNISARWNVDPGITEAMCEMHKRAMRTLMDDAAPILADTAQLIVKMYDSTPHSSLLDLSKQVIQLFAKDANHQPVVMMLFQSLCSRTFKIYETGIRDHPDIAEGFMSLLTQVVKKTPVVILNEQCNISGLFEAGMVSISMPENLTVKVACSFLTEMISLHSGRPDVKEMIVSHGNALLQKLMMGIGGESPRSVVDHQADVMFAMIKNHTAFTSKWCHDIVSVEGFPSQRITVKDKERFVKRIVRDQTNKKRFREAIQEFSLQCRGLIGTEYASQTSKIM